MAASWISAAGIILALLHLAGEWRSSSDDDSRALSPTRRNMAARTLDFRQILFVFSFSSSLSLTTRKSVSSSVEYNVSCESRTAHACVRRSASVGTRTRSFGVGIPGTARSRSARPAASHLIDRDRRPSYPYDCSLFTRYEKYMFYYKYFRKQRNKFYRKNRNTQCRKNKMFLNEWKKNCRVWGELQRANRTNNRFPGFPNWTDFFGAKLRTANSALEPLAVRNFFTNEPIVFKETRK